MKSPPTTPRNAPIHHLPGWTPRMLLLVAALHLAQERPTSRLPDLGPFVSGTSRKLATSHNSGTYKGGKTMLLDSSPLRKYVLAAPPTPSPHLSCGQSPKSEGASGFLLAMVLRHRELTKASAAHNCGRPCQGVSDATGDMAAAGMGTAALQLAEILG
eukprot:CAMPEP_0172856512 /NCGR_PEP_ID=MMETSP1075-20121228/64088_1 /TAXON_ID=2916 /ORGANISM="Ceratium fusus, Strain PA161109" /LENGTH=157 /DNA_ID=CAMNT_0013703715 /DNA_START=4 /DNA_END=474 /DNA_ORIENTATION=+